VAKFAFEPKPPDPTGPPFKVLPSLISFTANCAACHAGGNNAIMPEKTLKNDVLRDNEMNSIEAITNQVKNGKNAMPAFGGRLADEEIDNVANYVLSKSEKGW